MNKLNEKDFFDAIKHNFNGIFDEEKGNPLESYCRFIKCNEAVGDFKIKNGSNHKERISIGKVNKIDFDSYFLYYKYEYLNEIIGGLLKTEHSIGFLKNDSVNFLLFNNKTNERILNQNEIELP